MDLTDTAVIFFLTVHNCGLACLLFSVAQANWGRGWQLAMESDFPDEYSLSTFVGAGFGKLNRLFGQVRKLVVLIHWSEVPIGTSMKYRYLSTCTLNVYL